MREKTLVCTNHMLSEVLWCLSNFALFNALYVGRSLMQGILFPSKTFTTKTWSLRQSFPCRPHFGKDCAPITISCHVLPATNHEQTDTDNCVIEFKHWRDSVSIQTGKVFFWHPACRFDATWRQSPSRGSSGIKKNWRNPCWQQKNHASVVIACTQHSL